MAIIVHLTFGSRPDQTELAHDTLDVSQEAEFPGFPETGRRSVAKFLRRYVFEGNAVIKVQPAPDLSTLTG